MPAAKKPVSPSLLRSLVTFTEPAALKQLTTKSLEAAQEALAELRKGTGRDVGQGARELYSDLRTFVGSARRDTGKLAKALQRDFAQAQKQLARGHGRRKRSQQACRKPFEQDRVHVQAEQRHSSLSARRTANALAPTPGRHPRPSGDTLWAEGLEQDTIHASWDTLCGVCERRTEHTDHPSDLPKRAIDRQLSRRDIPVRERTLWRMLYETAARASAILALDVEQLDLANRRAPVRSKGGQVEWVHWGTGTAHLLPRLLRLPDGTSRTSGLLFLAIRKPTPARQPPPRDVCPHNGRPRLGYDRARVLLHAYTCWAAARRSHSRRSNRSPRRWPKRAPPTRWSRETRTTPVRDSACSTPPTPRSPSLLRKLRCCS